jgi:protein-disulfide isomerase
MASRKEQKEQARAARIALQERAAAKAQRTRRIQVVGGAIAIAVVVIVVAVVVSSSGASKPKGALGGLVKGKQERQLVSSVSSLLTNIPQSGTTLGKPSAPVTMQYFGDLECPVCQAFTLLVFPTFVQQEVKTGHVKVVYRSSCTATCNDYKNGRSIFANQQVAAEAAGKQDKFWQYTELFYHQQGAEGSGYVTPSFIKAVAKQVPGLNIAKWTADRKQSALLAQVNSDESLAEQAAKAAGESGTSTPTLVMDGPKGDEIVSGTYSYAGTNFAFPSPSALEQAVTTVS